MKILIKNSELINPFGEFSGVYDILIANGKVSKIGKNLDEDADKIIDAKGLFALPAFIDMHVHLRDPGQEYSEDIVSGTKAAANGGFATVCCMPNTAPVNDNAAITKYIIERANKDGNCKVYPIGAITKNLDGNEISEMGLMRDAGCIAFSDDGKYVENGSLMRNALLYAKGIDTLIISHSEDKSISGDGQINEGYYSTVLGLRGISCAAEEAAIARDLILAKTYNCKIHIAHVSTKGSAQLIKNAKDEGVQVSAETCPHYFSLTDEALTDFDTNAKVNPPLRTQEDIEAIIDGLKTGVIDCIATDHAPHHADKKNVEFNYAAFGISGIDIAFALTNTYLNPDKNKLVELMSKKPAEILGIDGGVIKEGGMADIALVDFDSEYILTEEMLCSKSKNTPFIGKKLKGQVRMTICGGKITKELI